MPLKITSGLTVLLFGLVAAGAGFAEQPDRPSKGGPEGRASAGDLTSPPGMVAVPHIGAPGGLPGNDSPTLQNSNEGADNSGRVDAKDPGEQDPSRINRTNDAVDEHPDASADNHRAGPQGHHGASQHSAPGAPAGTKEAPAAANPIDTSITVQPRRTAKNAAKHSDSPKKPHPMGPSAVSAEGHQKSAAGRRGHEMRNAIGVSVPGRPGTPPADSAHGTTPVVPPGGMPSSTGPIAGAAGSESVNHPNEPALSGPGAQKTGAGFAGSVSHPLTVSPTAGPATGINGTGLVRPGHGPAVVGGAAKNLASINGTTIHLKH